MHERDIFIAALQQESRTQRNKYLDEACGGDVTLRQQVEALLEVHDRAGSFLQEPLLGQVGAAVDVWDHPALTQLAVGADQGSDTPQPEATSSQTDPAHETSTYPEPLSLGCLAPPQEPDELGRLGHYRVLRRLGQGGMGIVFLADDTRLQRPVALKVMRPELAVSSESRQRFLREARAAARIHSDHVVTIYHVDQENDLPYLVMEVLRGQSLAEALERGHRLSLDLCLKIARETAEGLAAAHASGLIHRDVKPGNIWLEEYTDRVKLLDFGLARARTGPLITQRHIILGTPAYMSPEQAAGQPLDFRCDLFSLGAVLYHMLTGCRPFPGDDVMTVLASLANATPPPAASLVPGLPAGVAGLLDQLLIKNPSGRPASAAETVRALLTLEQEVASFAPAAGKLPGPTDADTRAILNRRATPPARRRRRRLLLAVGLGLVGLAVGLLAAAQSGSIYGPSDAGSSITELDPLAPSVPSAPTVPPDGASRGPAPAVLPNRPELPPIREFSLAGHGPQVQAVAFTADSKTLISAGFDGQVIFWDMNRREKWLRITATPFGQLQSLAIDPQMHWLAVGQMSPEIRLFRFGEPLSVGLLKGHTDRVVQLAFLKDGQTLLSTGYDGSIRSWDVEKQKEGKPLLASGRRLDRLAVWEDGKGGRRLAMAGPNFVAVEAGQLERLPYQPLGIAISPDGTLLAGPARARGVALWALPSNTLMGVIPEETDLRGLVFTPDGKHIVVMGINQTCIYRTDGGKQVARIDHAEDGISLAVSPDGLWLAVGTMKGLVRVWHLPALLAPPG
jgi:hypothetical protein